MGEWLGDWMGGYMVVWVRNGLPSTERNESLRTPSQAFVHAEPRPLPTANLVYLIELLLNLDFCVPDCFSVTCRAPSSFPAAVRTLPNFAPTQYDGTLRHPTAYHAHFFSLSDRPGNTIIIITTTTITATTLTTTATTAATSRACFICRLQLI